MPPANRDPEPRVNRRTTADPTEASKAEPANTAKAGNNEERNGLPEKTGRAKPSTTASQPAKATPRTMTAAQRTRASAQPAKTTTQTAKATPRTMTAAQRTRASAQPAKTTTQPAAAADQARPAEAPPRRVEPSPTEPARPVFYLPPTQAYTRAVEPPWTEAALSWLRNVLQESKPAAGWLRNPLPTSKPAPGWLRNPLPTSKPAPGWLPKRLRQVVIVLLVFSVCGFLLDGVKRVPHPYLLHLPQSAAASPLSTFGSASLTVAPGPGLKAPKGALCALEASNLVQQQQGLMGVTNLGGYAGMVFVFGAPSRDRFYMKGTNIPLSIAWFGGAGHYLGSTVMPPCPVGLGCPTYGPGSSYMMALEVEEGKLGSYGIGPGSTLHLGGSCTP